MNKKKLSLSNTLLFRVLSQFPLPFLILLCFGFACQSDNQQAFLELSEEERHQPENSLLGIELHDGLEATLFASEDRVINPTNMDIDERGRVWITEGVNYRPTLNPQMPVKEEGDRIVILEDTNEDGRADSEKVFYQGRDIDSALGIMVLGNKVIVSRSPNVFIFTDTTGNDQADTKDVFFTGIGGEQHDHGVHAFVLGPDGKYYFNSGDAGEQFHDANGDLIVDQAGNNVMTDGNPYRKGMIFRVNRDGTEFEVLAHNFRNNYEVAVDSYGTLWQSDNDDDGNRSVRINYVMEFGNYGYTDEITGAGWRNRRINMEEEIHDRHWHQNDPGVVPNLLDTGAGSPTGILVYEGDLLPEVFHNEMIHADAGPNVVRSYPVEVDGAGYHAEIENIMVGVHNQWFRPSDVTVAPDGSIFVADWYDPGVGGHQVRASEKGRIYRIAPENTPYRVPRVDYSTPENAVKALQSPNHSIRSKAWLQLHAWGTEAESALGDLWNSEEVPPHYRARALWLLSKLDTQGTDYIYQALEEDNPDLRITGLRAARQLDMDIIPVVEQLVEDPSPQVRREAAIALRYNDSSSAPRLWAELANQHDGEDRWYLEALGIAADRQWDRFFAAWLEVRGEDWGDKAGRDIVWRARSDQALPMLAEIIRDPSVDSRDKPGYFRAFDFHTSSSQKQQVLVNLLNGDYPEQEQITFYTLRMLDRSALDQFEEVRQALERTLEQKEGSYEYLDLVEQYGLQGRNTVLSELLLTYPDSSLGVNSARYMLESNGESTIIELINSSDRSTVERTFQALSPIASDRSLSLLQSVLTDPDQDIETRRMAVEAFGSGSWTAEDWLLEMVRNGEIPPELEASAANVLMQAYRGSIREGAAEYLQIAEDNGEAEEFRPVSELIQQSGDIQNGRQVYQQLCQVCHQVDGEGINFGPDLSEIGDKLPKEGLYHSILEPNAGINFGYEGYILTLGDDSQVTGIIESETENELVLRLPGGMTNRYDISEIESRQQLTPSLMPDLQGSMTEQELIDLVEYLATLTN